MFVGISLTSFIDKSEAVGESVSPLRAASRRLYNIEPFSFASVTEILVSQ